MSPPILLYIEDEENDVFFMKHAFKINNTQLVVHSVADGPSAIAYFGGAGEYADRASFPLPLVVLLDINLPGCSGFEVLKWLRGEPQFEDLPVVMFSSSPRPEDKKKAHALGANDFMEKPVSGLDFVAVAADLHHRWMANCRPDGPFDPDAGQQG